MDNNTNRYSQIQDLDFDVPKIIKKTKLTTKQVYISTIFKLVLTCGIYAAFVIIGKNVFSYLALMVFAIQIIMQFLFVMQNIYCLFSYENKIRYQKEKLSVKYSIAYTNLVLKTIEVSLYFILFVWLLNFIH